MRIPVHEVHAALVHAPLTLMPAAMAVDLVAAATDNEGLNKLGRALMPMATASMAVAAVTGLAAQNAVHAEGRAHDTLVTHRTLNATLLGLGVALSAARMRSEKPGAFYLLAGLAGLGVMGYSAYLGSKMVYEYGVGVGAGVGYDEARSPAIGQDPLSEVARASVADVVDAVADAAKETARGDLVPELGNKGD